MESQHLEAYLAGELDAESRRQVEHLLRNDLALRESFVQQMQMESVLRELLGPGAESRKAEFNGGVVARLRSEGAGDPRGFAKSVLLEIVEEREGLRLIGWTDLLKTGVISAAASISLLLLLQSIIFREQPQGNVARAEPIPMEGYSARIERSEDPVWAVASAGRIREDGWLSTGLLNLEAGTALISFNSGATALVEGPAELSIESTNRMFLSRGRLTAEVPPAASGFTVNTPRFNAVDIGTRFGISVDDEGNSELHVMEGEVEVSRASGNSVPIRVREGLALRADNRPRTDLIPIEYGGEYFQLQIGTPSLPLPALCYTFDESVGAIIEDSGRERLFDVPMIASGELGRSPRRGPGRNGGGLVFQPGETLDVSLSRDFRLDEPHTVAFWVKLPPKVGRTTREDLIHYGPEEASWGVACNLESNRGNRGALRVEFGEAHVTGSTDLADGNWHHVSYRFLGSPENDLVSALHLFVDGKQESVSDFRSGSVMGDRAENLRIGGDPLSGFQGWIDDLTLFREAVSTATIQNLAK